MHSKDKDSKHKDSNGKTDQEDSRKQKAAPDKGQDKKRDEPKDIEHDSQASTKSTDSRGNEVLCPKAITDRGYALQDELGSGAFSKVYRATSKKHPNTPMACKRFNLESPNLQGWQQKCLKNEMKTMLKLVHPAIIKTYDAIKTRRTAFIFMHLAKNGSVGDLLKRTKKPIEEAMCRRWFFDISTAMVYIHDLGIAHRDVKPENFLLDDDSKKCYLTDFGFSCASTNSDKIMVGTNCGTDVYKAPELLSLIDGHVYDAKKTDMYAIGVSFFEALNCKKPLSDYLNEDDKSAVDKYLKRQQRKEFGWNPTVKLSKEAKDCCQRLLEPKPDNRMTAKQLKEHNWFSNLKK